MNVNPQRCIRTGNAWDPLPPALALPLPAQSLFDAKGMAGNIIHAIATTNAVVSGLIVTEALKILAGEGPEQGWVAGFQDRPGVVSHLRCVSRIHAHMSFRLSFTTHVHTCFTPL